MDKVRFGVIGLGQRGRILTESVLCNMGDVEITAVCDAYKDRCEEVAGIVEKKKGKKPLCFTDYKELLENKCVDAVFVATAWEYHADIAAEAMFRGKITALEVGGAYTGEDCWKLVNAYEKTKTPFMFMENCCFDRSEMMITAMVRDGLFGEIVHCSGAYGHDCREEITHGVNLRHYRLRNYIKRNCDNYPTHELGPIAKILDINRGNRMVSLVSVASKAAGIKQYVKDNPDTVDRSLLDVNFRQGDIVNTIITCANGETILLRLDTTLPRFYNREITVRGTKGLYEMSGNLVMFGGGKINEDMPSDSKFYTENINNLNKYENRYLPEKWKNITREEIEAGHGGMDAYEFRVFVDAIKSGGEMPIDVYDAASWMSISYLSEISIQRGGASVECPDFTSGKWLMRERKDVIDFKAMLNERNK